MVYPESGTFHLQSPIGVAELRDVAFASIAYHNLVSVIYRSISLFCCIFQSLSHSRDLLHKLSCILSVV